jgi:hypothetical protein
VKTPPEWINDLVDRIEQRFADLENAVKTSNNTVPDQGARPVPIEAGKRVRLATSGGTLAGFSLRETTGVAVAVVNLRDGDDANAALVQTISLAPAESVRDWFGDRGISLYNGLFMDVAAGAVDGAVFLGGVG